MINVTFMGLVWMAATVDQDCTDCNRELPSFEMIVPPLAPNKSHLSDKELQRSFPGQFYTEEQIHSIDDIENNERTRRDTDYDLCCPTKVWFGRAPAKMTDIEGKEWSIVCGDQVQQAFSRGDCISDTPQQSCSMSGGVCRQKTRLVWLWVEKEPGSSDYLYKYFRTNSHCAYENAAD